MNCCRNLARTLLASITQYQRNVTCVSNHRHSSTLCSTACSSNNKVNVIAPHYWPFVSRIRGWDRYPRKGSVKRKVCPCHDIIKLVWLSIALWVLVVIGSGNGLSSVRHQAITWTIADPSSIRLHRENFVEIVLKNQICSLTKKHF